MNQVYFTVAIPTYNGANRLPKILGRLREQVNRDSLSWEIMVVDNNSCDDTASVIKQYQDKFSNNCTLKYFFEAQQGSAFARKRAIEEAKSEWVGFLDDDVLPEIEWVEKAYQFAQNHPQAGAFSGQIHGAFEVNPPENFKKIQSFLAIIERGEKAHLYQPEKIILPNSAALVVQTQAWKQSVPERQIFPGRIGKSLVGAEDLEIMLHLAKAGWEIWYNPAMHAEHLIPKQRLERDYLIALSRSCGLSTCHLRLINAQNSQKLSLIFRILLGSDLRRALKYFWHNYRQFKDDLVAVCYMNFLLGSWLSPFYFLSRSIQVTSNKFFSKETKLPNTSWVKNKK